MILDLPFLFCCLLTVDFIYAIDLDYYFSALRSRKSCNNMTEKVNCQIKCGVDTGMCIGNDCYCLTVTSFKKDGNEGVTKGMKKPKKRYKIGQGYSDYNDFDELTEVQYERRSTDLTQASPEYLDESLLSNKPVLRHHIAHFCPNLEIARTCIRTCMTEGKPAFCGKDHVCYCGHKYSNSDINTKADAASVYAQFKDLYEKYFGPNYKPNIAV